MLSEKQVKMFWRLWAAGCQAQGWEALPRMERETKRRELLRRAGFESLKDVDVRAGFDAVKRELLLLQDNVSAGMETEDDSEARRLRWVIRNELLPCLALYVDEPHAYLAAIMRDKERWGKSGLGPTVDIILDDLSNTPDLGSGDSPLQQCLSTITARLDAFRSAAGHDLHTMRSLAGVRCLCRLCRGVPTNSKGGGVACKNPSPASRHASPA